MIGVESTPEALRITLRGKLILEHTPTRPCIMLAEGTPSMQMHAGHFKISETVQNPIAAGAWSVPSASAEDVLIDFPDVIRLRFALQADGSLFLEFSGSLRKFNRMILSLVAVPGEHVYGCGEQFSEIDLRGKKVPIWGQEKGIGRGNDLITKLANFHSKSGGNWSTTYFSQPTFVTSSGTSCHIQSSAYQDLDFSAPDRHSLYIWSIPPRVRVDVGSMDEVLGRLSAYLGRQPELPSWAQEGLWLGVQGGREVVRAKLGNARSAGIRVAAVWAQDWQGGRETSFGTQQFWNYHYDAILYPDLPEYIARLREVGVRFLGYINPMVVPEGDLYLYAKAKGYLVKNAQGNVQDVAMRAFPAGTIDLYNPDAQRWYKSVIRENMIDIGMSGWMADYGDSLPPDAVLGSGVKGVDMHNDYAVQWARTNREAIEEAGKLGDVVFFMRSGYSDVSKYATAHWAGEQLTNWSFDDGFATVIPAAISLGFCGIGYHHSDIGGYLSALWIKRSKELLLRWCEQAAFSPIMRTHEGNRPGKNWQFDSDAETLAHFAHMTQIHSLLGPYHREVGRQYAQTGLPPMRHPCLHNPSDPTLHGLKYQYLYGADLMVAPVVKKGQTNWQVYLPHDSWIHMWTGQGYSAGWHEVAAPIGKPPVFYREDSKHRMLFQSLRKIR